MRKVIDLTGKTFGRLTALEAAGRDKHGNVLWRCVCSCPAHTVRIVSGYSLRSGNTQSCCCLHSEMVIARNVGNAGNSFRLRHGHSRNGETPEYRAFKGARERCNNPNGKSYANYGGRGIKFLFTSFEEFLAELGSKPEPKRLYSLDRINNDGSYEPANIRWATRTEQNRNQRPHKRLPENAGTFRLWAQADLENRLGALYKISN